MGKERMYQIMTPGSNDPGCNPSLMVQPIVIYYIHNFSVCSHPGTKRFFN